MEFTKIAEKQYQGDTNHPYHGLIGNFETKEILPSDVKILCPVCEETVYVAKAKYIQNHKTLLEKHGQTAELLIGHALIILHAKKTGCRIIVSEERMAEIYRLNVDVIESVVDDLDTFPDSVESIVDGVCKELADAYDSRPFWKR